MAAFEVSVERASRIVFIVDHANISRARIEVPLSQKQKQEEKLLNVNVLEPVFQKYDFIWLLSN